MANLEREGSERLKRRKEKTKKTITNDRYQVKRNSRAVSQRSEHIKALMAGKGKVNRSGRKWTINCWAVSPAYLELLFTSLSEVCNVG